jgi:hypothetical protein
MKAEKEVIYFRESAIQSILSDFFMWGSLLFAFWFNHKYIDGNNFLDALVLILFFIGTFSRGEKCKRFTSRKKLLEFLESDGVK